MRPTLILMVTTIVMAVGFGVLLGLLAATGLNTWRDKLSDRKLVQNLQREIHTFKGGARMAGLSTLGDLSHSMETLLERIADLSRSGRIDGVSDLRDESDRQGMRIVIELVKTAAD